MSLLYTVVLIFLFIVLLADICRITPKLTSTKLERQYIKNKIKYPRVFFIE